MAEGFNHSECPGWSCGKLQYSVFSKQNILNIQGQYLEGSKPMAVTFCPKETCWVSWRQGDRISFPGGPRSWLHSIRSARPSPWPGRWASLWGLAVGDSFVFLSHVEKANVSEYTEWLRWFQSPHQMLEELLFKTTMIMPTKGSMLHRVGVGLRLCT